tara:strand:- start:1032 stop:1880 length:849 start_codon:yes stop_codon:yes gene_type:complete
MSTLQYRCETDDAPISGVIHLSDQSPWTTLLGTMPLPAAGAIEDLNETLNANRMDSVLLTGEPAACLLPLIWFRSIWTSPGTPVQIEWVVDDLESGSLQRQSAARLACLLADRVVCDQPDKVRRRWGFDPSSPGIAEEAYDLLIHLIDIWDPDLRLANLGEDWSEAMKKTLARCAVDGQHRVGIYGAGTHTRAVGDAFMQAPTEICCIIDDDVRRVGESLWGFPIVSPHQASQMNLDAVILSANSIEDLLWERASILREHGIATIKIYGRNERNQEQINARI